MLILDNIVAPSFFTLGHRFLDRILTRKVKVVFFHFSLNYRMTPIFSKLIKILIQMKKIKKTVNIPVNGSVHPIV